VYLVFRIHILCFTKLTFAGHPPVAEYVPKCPICQQPTEARFRPFCSKRCADIDLSRWITGRYAIAGHADAEEDSESQSAAAPPARRPAENGSSHEDD